MPVRSNLRQAIKAIKSISPRGATNIFDTLEAAFKHTDVDTIYLLSDGTPTDGKFIDGLSILREISLRNRLRKIVIHTISIGANPLMKSLAEENHGTYVETKAEK